MKRSDLFLGIIVLLAVGAISYVKLRPMVLESKTVIAPPPATVPASLPTTPAPPPPKAPAPVRASPAATAAAAAAAAAAVEARYLQQQLADTLAALNGECSLHGSGDAACTIVRDITGKDPAAAQKILQERCLSGFNLFLACALAGRLFPRKDVGQLDEHCHKDNPRFCAMAAGLFLAQDGTSPKASPYLIEACNKGYPNACLQLGTDVNREERTQEEQRCENHSGKDCLMVGGTLENRVNLPSLAKGYMDKACNWGESIGCLEWGSIVGKDEIAAHERGCSTASPQACVRAAAYYRYQAKDYGTAKKLLETACTGKDALACTWLKDDEIGFSQIR